MEKGAEESVEVRGRWFWIVLITRLQDIENLKGKEDGWKESAETELRKKETSEKHTHSEEDTLDFSFTCPCLLYFTFFFFFLSQ